MSLSLNSVDRVRSFSRAYTRRLGILKAHLLDSPFSLTESRVLYEIAHGPGILARNLDELLAIDRGYLSRILARFQRLRLVRTEPGKTDGRCLHLHLTAKGHRLFSVLNRRSSAQVRELVGHLPDADQERLAESLDCARLLLTPPEESRGAVLLREPRPGELGWVVQRHGALYAAEYGWDVTFETLVAGIVGNFGKNQGDPGQRAWIAELEGVPVGSVFLIRESEMVAKLRLLLVEPSARGRGTGHRLVAECLRFAREAGYQSVTLWTNSVLTAARRIYEQAGFRLVKEECHRSFGHDLVGQNWSVELAPRPE
jgi:DNA-binding MarR family transcriptional regulator/GNAT superfamily N-acetyltransferase